MLKERQISAFEDFSMPICNTVERAQIARECIRSELSLEDDVARALPDLFSHARERNTNFERDMDSVDRLLKAAANLQVLDPSDPLQVALVAQQRQHFHEEVLRIDRQYQEASLLRLIPMGATALQGLREALQSRKP